MFSSRTGKRFFIIKVVGVLIKSKSKKKKKGYKNSPYQINGINAKISPSNCSR